MVSLANAIKKEVKVPVIAAGRISTPAKAESILKEKKAELIGLSTLILMGDWCGCSWQAKKRAIFFNGEVFFLLTSPLMGDPIL